MTRRYLPLVTLLVAVGLVTGSTALAQTQAPVSIETESADPGASTVHIVVVVIDENTTDDVEGLRIDYGDADVDTSEIDDNRIEEFGIDRDGDEPGDSVDVRLDEDIAGVDSFDDGRGLVVDMEGSRLAGVGDEVVLSYRITNPAEAGTYQVAVTYNPEGVAATGTAELQIGEPQTAQPTPVPTARPTATPTVTETPTATAEPTPTPTDTPSPTPQPTPEPTPEPTPAPTTAAPETTTTSPGFGVVVGLVAVVAAIVLTVARRRR